MAAIGSEHPAVIQTLIIATDPVATLFDKILPACGYVETSDLMEPRMGLLAGSPTEKGSWTGPGPADPSRDSDTARAASERHADRAACSATPGSANQRTDRP